MKEWTSIHIYYHDFKRLDIVIRHLIPELRDYYFPRDDYFFLRYWEGGPHVRLRVNSGSGQELTKSLVEACQMFLQQTPCPVDITKEQFYLSMGLDATTGSNMLWFPNNSVEIVPYTPEFELYGDAVDIATQFFYHSSELCLRILRTMHSMSEKFNAALLTLILFLSHYMDHVSDGVANFLDHYYSSWSTLEDKYRVSHSNHREAPMEWEDFAHYDSTFFNNLITWNHALYNDIHFKGMVDSFTQLKTVKNQLPTDKKPVVAGLLHTTNNRLGLTPANETIMVAMARNWARHGRMFAEAIRQISHLSN